MHVVIIGGTSGIGKELALLFVSKGSRVAITGRRWEKLNELKALFPEKIIIKKHDVMDFEESEKVLNELVKEFGTIDLIVYSSGTADPNYELEWVKEIPTLHTNVLGATRVFGLAYNLFKKQSYGHLVGISSVAGIRGNRHVPAYFASKAYQNNYMESLWLKAKRSKAKISVTNILPGFVDTDMALGKTFWMATPQKAAQQIYEAILKKKKSAYVTKRWAIVAFILNIVPAKWLLKL